MFNMFFALHHVLQMMVLKKVWYFYNEDNVSIVVPHENAVVLINPLSANPTKWSNAPK